MINFNKNRKPPKPLIVNLSRVGFFMAIAFGIYTIEFDTFATSELSYIWIIYALFAFYILEQMYSFFAKKKISLAYAYPAMLSVYLLNLVSVMSNAQVNYPLVNRAEHYLSFIIYTSAIWIFFLKYLPQDVWRKHPYYTSLIVFSVTSTFGILNELIELTFDFIFSSNYIGNRLDTPLDLLMNSLGIATFLGAWLILGPKREEVAEVIEASTHD